MTALATTIAFACGLAAGLPQIARMIRRRNSEAQSPLGWAIGAKGAAATAYLGATNGAAPIVYGPSLAGATVALVGLGVTMYFGPSAPPVPKLSKRPRPIGQQLDIFDDYQGPAEGASALLCSGHLGEEG